MQELNKIAVLIDADHTPYSKMEALMQELSTRGRIVLKRAYGNWKKEKLKNWDKDATRLAIKMVHQPDYVTGKNATDIALSVDAMGLLHNNIYDCFVIVASDSDYTPLAIKLKESGVTVIGSGMQQSPPSFKNACDEFLLLENIASDEPEPEAKSKAKGKAKSKSVGKASAKAVSGKEEKSETARPSEKDKLAEMHDMLRQAWELCKKVSDDSDFAFVSEFGNYLKRIKPDFDTRSYGYKQLSRLLAAFPDKYELSKDAEKALIFKCRN